MVVLGGSSVKTDAKDFLLGLGAKCAVHFIIIIVIPRNATQNYIVCIICEFTVDYSNDHPPDTNLILSRRFHLELCRRKDVLSPQQPKSCKRWWKAEII